MTKIKMKINRVIGLLVLMICCVNCSYSYDYESVDYKNLYVNVKTINDIQEKRDDLNSWIWKDVKKDYTPTVLNDSGNANGFTSLDLSNTQRIDRLKFVTDASFTSYTFLYVPNENISNNRLFIYSNGHSDLGGVEIVQDILDEGYYVLIHSMPCVGLNTAPVSGSSVTCHNNMNSLESSSYNPVEDFLNDIYSSINYLETQYTFTDISMTGISGGGWTATVYPATDERVINSYPVAGTYPRFIFDEVMSGDGDYEQGSDADVYSFLTTNTSYLDMYILGATNGRTIVINNEFDSCCFAGNHSTFFKDYITNVSNNLDGNYDSYITTGTEHAYTTDARELIISTNNDILTTIINKSYIKVNINVINNLINTSFRNRGRLYSTSSSIINFFNIIWGEEQ